jgi:transcriptional regulator with XRE-family HTH domain
MTAVNDDAQVQAWRADGMTEEEIAGRLGMTIQQVGQWFGQRSAMWLER